MTAVASSGQIDTGAGVLRETSQDISTSLSYSHMRTYAPIRPWTVFQTFGAAAGVELAVKVKFG